MHKSIKQQLEAARLVCLAGVPKSSESFVEWPRWGGESPIEKISSQNVQKLPKSTRFNLAIFRQNFLAGSATEEIPPEYL